MDFRRLLTQIQLARISMARWIDAFWGYDVFIAHRRADGASYAAALFKKLTSERITTFIDREVYGPGDSLLVATRRHVAKSTVFVLLGSPEILAVRKPVDWVEREIDTYLATHAADPKLVLIDFGGLIDTSFGSADANAADVHPILRQVAPFVRLREEISALSQAPSEEVLNAVRRELKGRRRDRNRLRFFQGVAAVLALLALAAIALAFAENYQAHRAFLAQQRAIAEARTALSRQAAAQASVGAVRPDLRLLLAIAALQTSPTIEARRSLFDALWINPLPYYYLWTGRHEEIEGLQFSPDESRLRAMSGDGMVYEWDIAKKELNRASQLPIKDLSTFAYDQGGAIGAVASVPLGGRPPTAWMLDPQMTLMPLKLPPGTNSVRGMAFSGDGRYLAATSPPDGTVILWDRFSQNVPHTLPCPGAATGVTFSSAPGLLATSCDDGVRIWTLNSGAAAGAFTLGKKELANSYESGGFGHETTITTPAFAAKDSQIVAGVRSGVVLWNVRSRKPTITLSGHRDYAVGVAVSPDGTRVAAGGFDGLVLVWKSDQKDPYQILAGHNTAVYGVTYSPSGRWLASYGDDGTIVLWDTSGSMSTATVLNGPWSGAHGIAASPDGNHIALLNANDELFVTRDGSMDLQKVASLKDVGSDLSTSSDGSVIAYSTSEGRVVLVDPSSGVTKLLPQSATSSSVAVSPDGGYLALVQSAQAAAESGVTISIVRRTSGEIVSQVKRAHTADVNTLRFSQDGHWLASGADDGMIKVWSVPSLTPAHQFKIDGGIVRSLEFSPTAPLLASGDSNGDIQLWNLGSDSRDGEPLRGHGRPVFALGFTADGATMASGGGDSGVIIWDVNSRQALSPTLRLHSSTLHGLSFRAQGRQLLSWDDDGRVISWDLGVEHWRAQACAMANRPISATEWRQYMGAEQSSYQALCTAAPPAR